jgi:hypothetical protein
MCCMSARKLSLNVLKTRVIMIFEQFFKFVRTKIIKKNVSCSRKKTFYLQSCMVTPEGHQKRIFSTYRKLRKEPLTFMGLPNIFAG